MKHLFSCLKHYRREAVLAPLFKLFEAGMELLVPLVVASIVDDGIANGDKMYLLWACLLLIGLGAAGLGFALTAQYFAAKAAVGTSSELRTRLFCKLQSLSYAQIDELGTSAMITRLTSDCRQVQTGVNMTLRLLLRSPIVVFGAAAMAFVVDGKAALVFVAVIPLLAVAVVAVMAASIPLYKKVQERLDGVQLSVRENLQGVRVIRAFCREEEERAAFTERNASLCREQRRAGRISALTNPLTYVLINLAVIVLVYVGALRVDSGALEQGDVLALYSYLSLILVELVKLANLVFTVSKAISSEKRVEKVLRMEGEPRAYAEDGETDGYALSFSDVSFTYAGGGAPALSHIDVKVKAGETLGIVGGTGAGKTTLIDLIPRFYRASEGAVRVLGKNVDGIDFETLRETVGVVPQKSVLFRGSIRSNLLWGNPNATEERLLSALKIAQAEDVVDAKGGLDGEIAQEGKNLSGGQRQRLSIARALVRDPKILILDDSSSALDYATDARLRAALKMLGRTVVIVSQRTASVRHADQILVLDNGKMAGLGTHEELLSSCPLYREIDASQGGVS